MKIIGLTIMTNPAYRQDTWREWINQALEIFDEIVIIVGRKEDIDLIYRIGGFAGSRIHIYHKEWPQPDWSYEELPIHLNFGLDKCRINVADWVVKLDSDTFIHEKDRRNLKEVLENAKAQNKKLVMLEKYQFILTDRCYEKGKIPLCINMDFNIRYGYDKTRQTDLCQPIHKFEMISEFTNTNAVKIQLKKSIPSGIQIDKGDIVKASIHAWNYDYTFKTEPRSRELLYFFDRAHAKFWGCGYSGKQLNEITEESAFNDFIILMTGRIEKMNKTIKAVEHPKYIRSRIDRIAIDEFGYNLWGLIKYESRP